MIQKLILVGNLGKPFELKTSKAGTPWAEAYTLANSLSAAGAALKAAAEEYLRCWNPETFREKETQRNTMPGMIVSVSAMVLIGFLFKTYLNHKEKKDELNSKNRPDSTPPVDGSLRN